jgi:subtilisin family serine protease
MKANCGLLILLVAALTGCAPLARAPDPAAAIAADLSRQLLITTRQDVGATLSVRGDPGAFYLRRRGYGPTPTVDRTLDQIAADYGLQRLEGWYIASLGEYCEVYALRPDQDADAIIRQISADARVGIVQAMNSFETEAIVYDDPYAPMQTALSTLAIEAAHETATGRGITVAVVDSSVDRRHRELRGRIRSERNLVLNVAYAGAEVHGTAVAGIIGSRANNGEGIVGIAPAATIVSLRACWTIDASSGRARCSSFSLAHALESASRLKADVINLSLAGPPDALLKELIDAAVSDGIIVVAAGPATLSAATAVPSSQPGVLAAESAEAPVSPWSPNLLRAPGTEILSTVPNNGYAFFSGNSMSAAFISGVSALVRERRPGMRPEELIRLLAATGQDSVVNACQAVARVDGPGPGPGACGMLAE